MDEVPVVMVGEEIFVTLEEMGIIPVYWKKHPNTAMKALILKINHYMELTDLCSEYVTKLSNWVEQGNDGN